MTALTVAPGVSSMSKTDRALAHMIGRIRDVDTHEMFPARLWVREYGEMIEPMARFVADSQSATVPNSYAVSREIDDVPITPITKEGLASYWGAGCLAPGAYIRHESSS
jgi:hypothetical protein